MAHVEVEPASEETDSFNANSASGIKYRQFPETFLATASGLLLGVRVVTDIQMLSSISPSVSRPIKAPPIVAVFFFFVVVA